MFHACMQILLVTRLNAAKWSVHAAAYALRLSACYCGVLLHYWILNIAAWDFLGQLHFPQTNKIQKCFCSLAKGFFERNYERKSVSWKFASMMGVFEFKRNSATAGQAFKSWQIIEYLCCYIWNLDCKCYRFVCTNYLPNFCVQYLVNLEGNWLHEVILWYIF